MNILHIVRQLNDDRALGTMKAQREQGHLTTLLLLHDAVLSKDAPGENVLACQDDVAARGGKTAFKTVSYDDIVKLMVEHDKVILW